MACSGWFKLHHVRQRPSCSVRGPRVLVERRVGLTTTKVGWAVRTFLFFNYRLNSAAACWSLWGLRGCRLPLPDWMQTRGWGRCWDKNTAVRKGAAAFQYKALHLKFSREFSCMFQNIWNRVYLQPDVTVVTLFCRLCFPSFSVSVLISPLLFFFLRHTTAKQ